MKDYLSTSLNGFTKPDNVHTHAHPDGVSISFFHGPAGLDGNVTITVTPEVARSLVNKLATAVAACENAPQTPVAPLSATQDGNATAGSGVAS
jgi:hypothetical protein